MKNTNNNNDPVTQEPIPAKMLHKTRCNCKTNKTTFTIWRTGKMLVAVFAREDGETESYYLKVKDADVNRVVKNWIHAWELPERIKNAILDPSQLLEYLGIQTTEVALTEDMEKILEYLGNQTTEVALTEDMEKAIRNRLENNEVKGNESNG